MNYKWKYYSHGKLYPKEEGHITVPIRYEFPAVRCPQYNNDYCEKIIAILKVLVLSALLTLLGCTSIILYTNYYFKSVLLEDNKTIHAYCAEFNKAAVKSNAYLDSSQTGDILNVQPYYDNYDKNNFQRTSGYGKTRIVRKAENNKEEEFKKWLQSLDAKDLFSSINANPRFKADLKRFVDKPDDAGDDVQKLFAQVMTKYRNIVETYVKDLVINTFDAVDAQMFNSSTNSKNNKQDLDKNSNKN